MIGEGNADSKWSFEKKSEVGDSIKTVDCLRGRLLAERVASKNAKEEAEHLGNKLIELENLLKEETKSRNRAEKKLKYLMRKLEAMNISYVSDETEHSGSVDKNEISSVSSSISSGTKELTENIENSQVQIFTIIEGQESKETVKSSRRSENSPKNYAQSSALQINLPETKELECEMRSNENPISTEVSENFGQSVANSITVEDSLTSEGEKHYQSCSDSKINESDGLNQEYDQYPDNHIDDSLALVPVDTTDKKHERVDPEVLDATVKEALDALRHAKEQLQSSMQRRRANMIRVG